MADTAADTAGREAGSAFVLQDVNLRVRMGEFSTLVALELMSLAPGLGLSRLAEECRARAAGILGVLLQAL